MADEKGNIDMDKVAEFKPTMELQWYIRTYPDVQNMDFRVFGEKELQQKWVNELGEYEWRDIPLVIE